MALTKKLNIKVCEAQTYIIDKYIEVRLLENGQTKIFIDNKPFIQCKYLLINIPAKEFDEAMESQTIDDLKTNYSNKHEQDKSIIPYETEFWAHCSNLQVFSENNYNPATLHSNLSNPILKLLALKDVRIFHNLLFQLDDLINQYESTKRKVMLLNIYMDVLYKAIVHYGINFDDLASVGILKAYFIRQYIPNFLNLTGYECWACETRKQNKIDHSVVDIWYNCYNDSPSEVELKVCQECWDNGFPYEWEYETCMICYRMIPTDQTYYQENWDGCQCERCLKESYSAHGISEFWDCEITSYIVDENDYLRNGWKKFGIAYSDTIAIKHYEKLTAKGYSVMITQSRWNNKTEYEFLIKGAD